MNRKGSDSMSKILLINGSPHETGCTYTALSEVAASLHACGVDTELRRQVRWAKIQREAKCTRTNSSFHKPIRIMYASPYSFFPIHDFLQLMMNMEKLLLVGRYSLNNVDDRCPS